MIKDIWDKMKYDFEWNIQMWADHWRVLLPLIIILAIIYVVVEFKIHDM